VAVVDAVHRNRVLSTDQIASLFFPAADGMVSSACRTRLRHLAAAGFLERSEVPQTRSEGRRPYVYFLTAFGRDLLVAEIGYEPDEIDWKPGYNNVRWPFLEHQLSINDAYVAFRGATEQVGWTVERWVDDRFLKKEHIETVAVADENGVERQVAVVPDAYFILSREETLLHFFLEIDRTTMIVGTPERLTHSFARRIQAYQAYFASEAILTQYKTRKIRVLTVTTGERRLASLKAVTEQIGGKMRYWFTTADRLNGNTSLSSPIWQVASGREPYALLARP